jgi:hypothetical protein
MSRLRRIESLAADDRLNAGGKAVNLGALAVTAEAAVEVAHIILQGHGADEVTVERHLARIRSHRFVAAP